jgi:hypothetical protein
MTDQTPPAREAPGGGEPLLDSFLREAVPEIKLSLGDLIDRDNQRAIPDRYVKLLPVGTLVVTLRPDAARAVQPIAADLEAELTDSAMRHGSLYDRDYRVRLKEAGTPGAPLFRVSAQSPGEAEAPAEAPAAAPPPPPREPEPAPAPRAAAPAGPLPPVSDPDATRLEGPELPAFPSGRYALVLVGGGGEGAEGEGRPFPLLNPVTTVGRETDDPALRSDVQIPGHPSVSRRQLAVVWAPGEGGDGFEVYNVGLNALHVGEREVPGANAGRGPLRLEALDAHRVRVEPGTEIRIGGHGPVLRVEEAPEPAEDPDATQFE